MGHASDPEPGPLLARGRAADVYALDERRVLRRYRRDFDTEREARLIEHLRSYGYPTPAVHDIGPRELVLERVHGPTMGDDLIRRPWKLRASVRVLATLHDRLHAIPAPEWLDGDAAPAGDGPCIVHLDLHPLNVLIGPYGPVVIDWTNAGRGRADVDLALTWVLLRTGVPDDHRVMQITAALVGKLYARWFASDADPSGAALLSGLELAVRYRLDDPTLQHSERRAVTRLLANVP